MHQVERMVAVRALNEAGLMLKARVRGDGVLWKARIRCEWQKQLDRRAMVELLANGDLRVTCTKTRGFLAQCFAWFDHQATAAAL